MRELWRNCEPWQREQIALDFALSWADAIRDAVLDAEEAGHAEGANGAEQGQGRQAEIEADGGRAILTEGWKPMWRRFRDQALARLLRHGRIGRRN